MTIERSKNPGEFLDFERAGWGANIAKYDDAFGAVTRQTVGHTLDAAEVGSGMRVLDVCTGPGMMVEGAISTRRAGDRIGLFAAGGRTGAQARSSG